MADSSAPPVPSSADPTAGVTALEPSSSATRARSDAAGTIQRNYRGYRERRQLNGLGLDAASKWVEIVKEAQYQDSTRPRPRREHSDASFATNSTVTQSDQSFAQSEWKRLRTITRRAHDDDTSDTAGEEGMGEAELEEYRRKKAAAKRDREKNSKMMGLEYFLELVDTKHRYGSHLRSYHAIWKNSDTHENFFFWLDQGEGRHIDSPRCTREELDRDQVRYLTKEQRRDYMAKVDEQGRFRWVKNGELINTNQEFKDSLKGIVRKDDRTPAYREDTRHPATDSIDLEGAASSSGSDFSEEEGDHYVNEELHHAKGMDKIQYVSAAALLNHLLKSTTKKNTWIFVADTSFRLYVGIKQSGAFQHSSFLQGARIAAAGLIRIKKGQLRSLDPLSGHYRPPTSNFRAFVRTLKEEHVDMSRVSISRSYAILLGLEGYMNTKKRTKDGMRELERQMERAFRPEEAKRKAEDARDKSLSAQKEQEWLQREREAKKSQSWRSTFRRTSGDDPSFSRYTTSKTSH